MIEPIMYLAIGFLVSMLVGLMILPLVHNRAVRLTTKRLEAATPLSMAEIQADKDQLRAEFAMSARRLEMTVEQLKSKATSQAAELGKKSDAINRLKLELNDKNAASSASQGREKEVNDHLAKAEQEFAAKTELLATTSGQLAERQAELARLTVELADKSMTADNRKVELVAVTTQIDTLKARVQDAERAYAATQAQIELHRSESEAASNELAATRTRADGLNERITDLDRQLSHQVKEAERLGGLNSDLEGQLATQTKLLAEREGEIAQLKQAHQAAERTAETTAEKVSSIEDSAVIAPAGLASGADAELNELRQERDRLRRELETVQQAAESSWATERTENALLRERINDVAADVAKLAITLEGPDSTIEAILAGKSDDASQAQASNGNAARVPAGGTLADRIRALQSHAARAQTSN